jgi:cell wall-associated NlpC family hydrolase
VKHLIIIISVLMTRAVPASANHLFPPRAAADTAVYPVGDPEFLEHIVAGGTGEEEDDLSQDKKKKSSKNSTTTTTTSKSKRVTSPATKLAALTPDEENMIKDLSNKKSTKAIGIELSAPLQFKYAILLDMPVETINDNKLLELIESWYGTKYKYGGETRQGVDCSGFARAFMSSYYDITLTRSSADQYKQCTTKVKKKKLKQGDLVFFKTKGSRGGITHVGIYLCNNKFVHAATSTGVMISDLDEDYYKARFVGGGRILK